MTFSITTSVISLYKSLAHSHQLLLQLTLSCLAKLRRCMFLMLAVFLVAVLGHAATSALNPGDSSCLFRLLISSSAFL